MKTEKQKVLYIDTPFLGLYGGDKNRSKFLFKSLCLKYDTDILIIEDKEYESKILKKHEINKMYIIKSKKESFYLPQSIHSFDKKQIDYFKKILRLNQYDLLVFKFNSTAILANIAKKNLPFSNIIIDVDMLSSRICYDSWINNKSLKNRYYLIEYFKLYYFEKRFLKNNFTFFYTNEKEINLVKNKYKLQNINNHKVLPNVFYELRSDKKCKNKNRFILFYGMLNSTVNISAYTFLKDKIYPLIKDFLIKENIKILVIGRNKTSLYNKSYENIEVIGEVDDLTAYIKASEFVFLPLVIASGTLTRILEAAYLKKVVLTTTIGVEGLDMKDCIFIEDKAKNIALKFIELALNKNECKETGIKAYSYVVKKHSQEEVSKKLYAFIKNLKVKKINVIHIPRRFTQTHWGGTENVILSYAKGLKKFHVNSQVYTTKILNSKEKENIQGIKIRRFSYFYPYINLSKRIKEKLNLIGGNVFSFSLLFSLLFKKNIDLIHLHTFKRIGSIARIVCKLRNIPYIVSIHGGIYNRNVIETNKNYFRNSFEWGKILGFLLGSRRVIKDSNAVICLNKKEYEKIKEKENNKNIFLLPNSVDVSIFSKPKNQNLRKKYDLHKNAFICLVSARIDKQKNQLLLLKVLKKIKNEHENIHILFVGNITDIEYYKKIQEYIYMNSLEKYITFITHIKPESKELIDVYLNSNVLVLPSSHEPFGIVVLEAWASSLPVIVSEVAGVCNSIEDKKDALIFENNSIESLEKNLLSLIKDKSLQNTLIRNAKETVMTFDTDIINARINSIYRQLLSRK